MLVLDIANKDQYQDLVNSNFSNANIMLFSTSDDVLGLLQEGLTSSNARISGLFCSEKGADQNEDKEIIEYFVPSALEWRRKVSELKYIIRGIYFDIHLNYSSQYYSPDKNAWYIDQDLTQNYPPSIELTKNTNYKLRCGKNDYVAAGKNLEWNVGNWNGNLRRNIYSNIKPLTKYDSYAKVDGGKELHIKYGY